VALIFHLVEAGSKQFIGDATIEHDDWWPMVGDTVPGTKWEILQIIEQQPGDVTLVVGPETY
jgi:hypothetical protein